MSLPTGIPPSEAYRGLVSSDYFRTMEQFSDRFLRDYADPLRDYAAKWVADPLHQWSRQWEYPFVDQAIAEFGNAGLPLSILDAGSGATFFPFYVQQSHAPAHVTCCDYDGTLAPIYDAINAAAKTDVAFRKEDLRSLTFEDEEFDVVYCISVLEHTNAYERIASEFRRVLRPGGRLIVTLDISLDGLHDVPREKAQSLLETLCDCFKTPHSLYPSIRDQLERPGIVTTAEFVTDRKHLLPWRRPGVLSHLKSFARTGSVRKWPADLSFYCFYLTK